MIEVAKAHTIDAADAQLREMLNRQRIGQLAEKHQLTEQEIKAGIRRGNVISADEYEIADIGSYRDLAESQYEIRGNDVLFRPLDGWWPEALRNAAEFKVLREKKVVAKHARKPLSPL